MGWNTIPSEECPPLPAFIQQGDQYRIFIYTVAESITSGLLTIFDI